MESFAYDYDILKPTSYTDFNSNTTTLSYADPLDLDRLTNVTRPDGGQTNYVYTDAPGACSPGGETQTCPNVRTYQDLSTAGDEKIVSQTDYDGLGRKALTWYNAPEGEIDTQYAYDGKNRLQTVSNPFLFTTTGATTYTYDVLDRPLTVTAQDNSVTSYVYYGDTTTLTNTKLEIEPPAASGQNGNNRLYFTDALGHLVQVNENQKSWQGTTYGRSIDLHHNLRLRRARRSDQRRAKRAVSQLHL